MRYLRAYGAIKMLFKHFYQVSVSDIRAFACDDDIVPALVAVGMAQLWCFDQKFA